MLPDITFDELKACSWKGVVSKASDKNCLAYFSLFSSEASNNADGTAERRACQLLAALCSMDFAWDMGEEAYIPFFSGSAGRSPLPQDLSEQHVEALYQFLGEIDDPELKARLADSIWLKKQKYKFESAKIAVPEYMKTIESLKATSEPDAIKRLCRVVSLTHEMGRGGSQQQQVTLDYVETYAMETPDELAYGFHYRLFKMLCDRKYGDLQKLAMKCKDIANHHESINSYHLMRSFLNLYHDFIKNSGADSNSLQNVKVEEAESYVFEAENADSAMKKTFFLELAIKAFRNIPNSSDRVDELHAQFITEQQKVPDEMITFTTREIDITQTVNESESFVSGHSLFDALVKLSFILNMPNEAASRAKALASIQNNPISHLGAKRFTNEKGKTTGKVAPIDFNSLSIDDDIVTAEMFHHMSIKFNLDVESKILPALDKINSEHSLTLDVLLGFLSNNPFVPQGRDLLYARGILAGFKRDFVSSILYLVPQLENSIRNILEDNGYVITSKMSSSGIQKEKDLNELLTDDNVIKIFGEDIIFVLRSVMTERYGGNIRNLLAHGLLNYEQLQSSQSVFCWWVILRLVMTPFLNSIRP